MDDEWRTGVTTSLLHRDGLSSSTFALQHWNNKMAKGLRTDVPITSNNRIVKYLSIPKVRSNRVVKGLSIPVFRSNNRFGATPINTFRPKQQVCPLSAPRTSRHRLGVRLSTMQY